MQARVICSCTLCFDPVQVLGLTVDWVAHNIYWTDAVYRWIMMAPVKGLKMFRIVLDEGLDTPHGIAVHPASR